LPDFQRYSTSSGFLQLFFWQRSPRHSWQRSSPQFWQEKQSSQLCFFSVFSFSSGTYNLPASPGILTNAMVFSRSCLPPKRSHMAEVLLEKVSYLFYNTKAG